MKQPPERINIGLKVLIFRVHYIKMYFADIKFPYKESVRPQALGLKTKHLNRHHDCHATWIRITDEIQKED